MSNPTSNFGWQMPTPTDLVTDLPADFEVFGQAVDTSLADLKGGTTGQVLSKNSNTDMDFVWVTDAAGDITGVTAGTGISGGGTSGTVTITNSMATEITAKGDLIVGTGSATFDNLAAGANGSTIVADSSASTGLRYQSNFAAGKNAIINGAFNVWQRGTTQALTTGVVTFLADRYQVSCSFTAGTSSVSQQTFTPGTAPVAGYEGTYFQRITCGSTSSYFDCTQKIEDVRTFAGQTVTYSFWAKASAATDATMLVRQNFGSGGSANVNASTAIALTTSWQRFTFTTTLGGLTGKTIGTNSYVFAVLYSSGAVASGLTVDTWGWQLEASNTATAFQTATGTIQGELAACQRYFTRLLGNTVDEFAAFGNGYTTGQGLFRHTFNVKMRSTPTLSTSAMATFSYQTGSTVTTTPDSIAISGQASANVGAFNVSKTSGFTVGAMYLFSANSTTSAYLDWSAEL